MLVRYQSVHRSAVVNGWCDKNETPDDMLLSSGGIFPGAGPDLALWAATQRNKARSGTMLPLRQKALDSLEFS